MNRRDNKYASSSVFATNRCIFNTNSVVGLNKYMLSHMLQIVLLRFIEAFKLICFKECHWDEHIYVCKYALNSDVAMNRCMLDNMLRWYRCDR